MQKDTTREPTAHVEQRHRNNSGSYCWFVRTLGWKTQFALAFRDASAPKASDADVEEKSKIANLNPKP